MAIKRNSCIVVSVCVYISLCICCMPLPMYAYCALAICRRSYEMLLSNTSLLKINRLINIIRTSWIIDKMYYLSSPIEKHWNGLIFFFHSMFNKHKFKFVSMIHLPQFIHDEKIKCYHHQQQQRQQKLQAFP